MLLYVLQYVTIRMLRYAYVLYYYVYYVSTYMYMLLYQINRQVPTTLNLIMPRLSPFVRIPRRAVGPLRVMIYMFVSC